MEDLSSTYLKDCGNEEKKVNFMKKFSAFKVWN